MPMFDMWETAIPLGDVDLDEMEAEAEMRDVVSKARLREMREGVTDLELLAELDALLDEEF